MNGKHARLNELLASESNVKPDTLLVFASFYELQISLNNFAKKCQSFANINAVNVLLLNDARVKLFVPVVS